MLHICKFSGPEWLRALFCVFVLFCCWGIYFFFGLLHVSLIFYRELSYLTKNADMEVDCLPLEPAWTFSYFIGFAFFIWPFKKKSLS